MRRRFRFSRLALAGVAIAPAISCAPQLDTARSTPPRGTIGEELYGVLCDRVGAQAIREDLTGASFHAVCHKAPDGTWAAHVDQTQLPAADPNAVDVNGNPVSVDQQNKSRAFAVARVEALPRRRADLIAAFDATFPDGPSQVKDIGNPDPTKACGVPAAGATDNFGPEFADLLARFGPLYDDGTIPQSTEALARLYQALQNSADAQTAYARFDARQGYRPLAVALGAMRPMMAYGKFRDFSNALLPLFSIDSKPYQVDVNDNLVQPHVLVPGVDYAQLQSL